MPLRERRPRPTADDLARDARRPHEHSPAMQTLRKTRALLGPGQAGKLALLAVLALVASVVEAAGALVVFALLTRIMDEQATFEVPFFDIMPDGSDTSWIVVGCITVASFFVVRAVVLVSQSYLQSRVTENAAADLATRLVSGYLAMPYSFLLQRNSAELIRNTYDTVQQYARDALRPAIKLVSQSLIVLALGAV